MVCIIKLFLYIPSEFSKNRKGSITIENNIVTGENYD